LDGVIVAATCRLAADTRWNAVCEANDLVTASLTPPTLRHASRDLGEQLLALALRWPWAATTARALRDAATLDGWHHAPVFGALACAAGASPGEALAVYLHQAALGGIGAGVRAVPIGHSHGQQILARLHEEIAGLSAELADRELETAGSFSPAYDELCQAQSRLYTRLFRS
jgi:urease accessory protein